MTTEPQTNDRLKKLRMNSIVVKFAGIVGIAVVMLTLLTSQEYGREARRMMAGQLAHAAVDMNEGPVRRIGVISVVA